MGHATTKSIKGAAVVRKKDTQTYALELTAIFVSGLGMMLLVVISVWVASMVAIGSGALSDESVGSLPSLNEDSAGVSFLRGIEADAGKVAGVVDESSTTEDDLRNDITNWLSDVRDIQRLPIAYRDSVLDRNAQNQARFLANSCDQDRYSDWSESLGIRVDEGYSVSFSEAIFNVSGTAFAGELPSSQIDYARLFNFYDAVGVGAARVPETSSCQTGFVIVFHVAEVN